MSDINQSRLIKHKFSQALNKQELNYREIIQPRENEFNHTSKWIERISDGRRGILPILYRFIKFKGEILELGAGSCWFASELSRLDSVSKIYCLDMSEFILKNVAPRVMQYLSADTKKITRVIGDFNKLYFQDEKFDYVVFDAALHHIPENNFVNVLREVHRVLKMNGKVVAIREPFLSPIPLWNKYEKSAFGLHGKKYSVTENIFTKRQWESMLKSAGFNCYFLPVGPQASNTLNPKNLIKKLINKCSLLKIAISYLGKGLIIVLEKS